jgi:hypothetical protein
LLVIIKNSDKVIDYSRKKVFNNNVILTEDDNQKRWWLWGCGFVFQKKAGDVINETSIIKDLCYPQMISLANYLNC